MNTTRFLSAAAAVVLGTGLALTVAGAPANAAPGTSPTAAACQSLGGVYEVDGDGGWWCTHPVGAELRDPALLAVCATDSWAYVVDDGNPAGTVAFYCSPALIS